MQTAITARSGAVASCSPACSARAARHSSPLFRASTPKPSLSLRTRQRVLSVRASADNAEVYNGVYGPWSVDETDLREVATYRAGLSVATTALVLGTVPALLPDTPLYPLLSDYGNALCLLGAGSLGVSLALIHIYVTPLKRFVQGLWAVGTLGGLYLMASQDESVPLYVMHHPEAMWLVGPLFAATTGLAFKEGMCYGKLESAALFFVIPTLCLAHLSGGCPEALERGLLAAFAVLAVVFAGRKWGQAPKDDIGDKSVFMFQAMPPEQQELVIRDLQRKQAERQAMQSPAAAELRELLGEDQ